MRYKKKLIVFTFIIGIISLMLIIILNLKLYSGLYGTDFYIRHKMFCAQLKHIVIIVAEGILPGIIPSFYVAVLEYDSEKKRVMDEFCNAADELIEQYKKINLFITAEPFEIVRNAIAEIDQNGYREYANSVMKCISEHNVNGTTDEKEHLLTIENKAQDTYKKYIFETLYKNRVEEGECYDTLVEMELKKE